MSANVETMMYVREVPWHGIGCCVEEAPTSADALRLAGLDWTVIQKNVKTDDGILIPGYKANIRDKDNKTLGIVTDKYKVVQNHEAFAFTDALLNNDDVRYECAGSLNHGRRVWMLARMPETEILGDKFENYLCFTNTHDGTGAVRVCATPVRVVCQNTLNLALNNATRAWSVKHMGRTEDKLHEAQMCLKLHNSYMENLKTQADIYANTVISEDQLQDILSDLFPVFPQMSQREANNVKALKDEFMICYFMPDIVKFRNTAWGVINAASDMATHNAPHRKTKDYRANNWGRVINGHPIIDGAVTAVNRMMATV